MNPLLIKLECGWRCRCGYEVDGYKDALFHASEVHGADWVVDPGGNIYDVKDTNPEDLRSTGLI